MTRRPPAKKKVHPLDLVSLAWIILVTFLLGLPIVLSDYGDQEELREGVFFLYLFLEFLPMLLYSLPVLLPDLSPHLFLPWLAVNTILLLTSTVLALSSSIPSTSLARLLLALALSLLLVFPVLLAVLLYLPLLVYLRKLVPNYVSVVRASRAYRRLTGARTASQVEEGIILRRKEQVRNIVITERDFEQFIFVNRAAQKWKLKLKKNQDQAEELKDILNKTDFLVNNQTQLETGHEKSKDIDIKQNEANTESLIYEKGDVENAECRVHFVTDV